MPGETADSKKVRVIKANTMLQAKVGKGPLDEKAVRRCQEVMDANKVDFAPLAREYLARLDDAVRQAREGLLSRERAVQSMTEPVMQLKAHASMFRYTLIGALANIMLGFLESAETIDEDAIDIVEAHHKTLKAIIANKMEGDGGVRGEKLKAELKDACARYYARTL